MQIAKGSVRLSPENVQFKQEVTPAEALILHRLHFKNASGSPLGDDWRVYGEAVTIEVPAKSAEPEWFNVQSGKVVPAKPAVPAVTHKRTQREEISRLKRKYIGQVKENGRNVPVFEAVFGTASTVRLPETFDEIEEAVGIKFPPFVAEETELSEEGYYRKELLAKRRADIVQVALQHKIPVSVEDESATIVANIMAARQAPAAAALGSPEVKRGRKSAEAQAA